MTNKKQLNGKFKNTLAVLLLLMVGAAILYLNLGSIAKTVAEKIGSETLGVKVAIGNIDIKAQDKSVTVHNVRIANPKGYSQPYAMKIGLINIAMDSFSKELLVFNDVTVKGSELFLEVNKNGTNLSDLKANIKRTETAPTEQATKKNEPPKVILQHFLLADAQLHPTVTLIKKDLKDITVPDIKLTGIGQKQNGVLAKEALTQIWDKISSTAVNASANAGMLEGISSEGLRNISSSITLPKDLKGQVSGTLKKANEKLKSVFGN